MEGARLRPSALATAGCGGHSAGPFRHGPRFNPPIRPGFKQKIEGIEKLQEVNGALTVWRGFNQFLRPIEEDNAQGAITNLSRNYSGADVGSLEIPEP
jgi:hypothetical protein